MTQILLIFLAFALIHSITVTQWFKHWCRRAFGDIFMRVWYRFLYTAVSGVTVAFAVYLIMQVPDQVLWTPPPWLRWLLHGVQIAGFLFGVQAFQYLDKWEFMGFRQVWRYITKREVAGNIEGLTEKELVTTGVYGIVRHPLYVAGLIIFTFSPIITVNGLTITVLADLYFIFGMFIEERRFVRIFGDQYREYMKQVPRMVPRVRNAGRGPWAMRKKILRSMQTALVLIVAAAALLYMQYYKSRERGDGTVIVDPAVERKLVERERVILRTWIATAFPDWVDAWRSRDARYEPSALRRDEVEAIDPALITPEDEIYVPLDDASQRALVSPDGTRYLEYTGRAVDVGEPDSELTLVDSVKGERQRLLFYGPSVRFDDAAWVDDDTVVVIGVGSDDGEPRAGSVQPLVWIFHLSNRLVATYSASAR